MNKIITLVFFLFINSNQALSLTCHDLLENKGEATRANSLLNFDETNRTLGYEIEISGNHIEELTPYLANAYGTLNHGRAFNFTLLNNEPLQFWKLEALSSNGTPLRTYDIHGFPDNDGRYTYHLFQDENFDQRILHSTSLTDLQELAFELMSEDAPTGVNTIQSEEAFSWRAQINHSRGVIEEREIILQIHDGRFELLLFLELEGGERVESGIAFQTRQEAFDYIDELINRGRFIGRSFVTTEFGVIEIIPESSGTEITQTSFIDLNNFATELIFPPVLRSQLSKLFRPLAQLNEDETLSDSDENLHLATHLNVGFDTESLIDVVDMMLKLNRNYLFFKNKYQINEGRTLFTKPLTQKQVDFLESLKEKDVVTRTDILNYLELTSIDTEDGPRIDKFFWLNLAHFADLSADDFRPALEIRIADSILAPERLEELADDVLRVIQEE